MDKTHNVFISHHGEDDEHLQRLKRRLYDAGYTIRNSSVDSTKHRPVRPSDEVIARYLRKGISWAGTFICLLGEETHTRDWVDFEIEQAHIQGKRIVGIYLHGCSNNVELPSNYKKYGGITIGWNSLDKLGDAMAGKQMPVESPGGNPRIPIFSVKRIKCYT